MSAASPPILSAWQAFYAMAGSSAAALTGLMFVVISLVGDSNRLRGSSRDGISTFSTPTVIHFCCALLISAILVAPWGGVREPAVLIGLLGIGSIIYVIRVSIRASKLDTYTPDTEDWSWYTALPVFAYLMLIAGAIGTAFAPQRWLYAFAGSDILLIFVGIHNAWDVVTYITFTDAEDARRAKDSAGQHPQTPSG